MLRTVKSVPIVLWKKAGVHLIALRDSLGTIGFIVVLVILLGPSALMQGRVPSVPIVK